MKKFYLILTTLFSIFSMTVWGQNPTGGQEESVVDPPTPAISQPKAWFEYIQPNQFGGNNFASAVKVYAFEPQQLAGSSTKSDAEYMAEYIAEKLPIYMEDKGQEVTEEYATGFFKEAINKDNQTYYDGRVAHIFTQYSINEDALNSKLDVKLKYIPKTGTDYSGYLPNTAYSLKVAGPMTKTEQTIPDWEDLPVQEDLTKNNPTTINLTDDEISYGQFLIMQNFYAGLINNDPIKNEGESIEIAFFRDNSSAQLASSNFVFSNVASITKGEETKYYSHLANAIYQVVTDLPQGINNQIINLVKDEYIENDVELAIPNGITGLKFTIDYGNNSLNQKSGAAQDYSFAVKGDVGNVITLKNSKVNVNVNLAGCTVNAMDGTYTKQVTMNGGKLNVFGGTFNEKITAGEGDDLKLYGGTFAGQPSDYTNCIYPDYGLHASSDVSFTIDPYKEKVITGKDSYVGLAGNEPQNLNNDLKNNPAKGFTGTNLDENLNATVTGDIVNKFVNVDLIAAKNIAEQGATNPEFDCLTFEVKPYALVLDGANVAEQELTNYELNGKVTFELPISQTIGSDGSSKYTYVHLFREENGKHSYVGDFSIKKDEADKSNPKYYVQIPSTKFGKFVCNLTATQNSISIFYPQAVNSANRDEHDSCLLDGKANLCTYAESTHGTMKNAFSFVNQVEFKYVDSSGNLVDEQFADMIEFANNNDNVVYKNEKGEYVCPNFVIDDTADGLFLPKDEGTQITKVKVLKGSYSRKLTNTTGDFYDFNTVCFPFDITTKDLNGASIGVYNGTAQSGGQATAHFTKLSSVKAGTPCIMQCENSMFENNIWAIDLAGRTITINNDDELRSEGNLMVGTYFTRWYERGNGGVGDAQYNKFKLEGNVFRKFDDSNKQVSDDHEHKGVYVYPFRAYLDLSGIVNSEVKSLSIMWEDEADGISELRQDVQFDGNAMNATMFNLNGQPVSKDYKGIVIVGGKKMLKK